MIRGCPDGYLLPLEKYACQRTRVPGAPGANVIAGLFSSTKFAPRQKRERLNTIQLSLGFRADQALESSIFLIAGARSSEALFLLI
jgi:hypothetical protein